MLDKYEEEEFIHQLNLPLIERKSKGWLFRCVICGDSKKNPYKKRGWILDGEEYDNLEYYCHNCGYKDSFKWFLKENETGVYEGYRKKEKKKYFENIKQTFKSKTPKIFDTRINIRFVELNKNNFISVLDHKESFKYCRSRKLPFEVTKKLYYCNNPKLPTHEMLIFPYYDNFDRVYGFQGRKINIKKFHTWSQENLKIYNIFNVDGSKPVYIFESIIDSVFVRNSIAMIGGDVPQIILEKIKNPIFVYDNDRHKETFNKIKKNIEEGHKVVIWPKDLEYNDPNEMVVKGCYTLDKLQRTIEANTYYGFEAKTILGLNMSQKWEV